MVLHFRLAFGREHCKFPIVGLDRENLHSHSTRTFLRDDSRMDEMTARPVSFLKWDDLPYTRRLQLCEMASYAPTCAPIRWNEWIPADRIRLASALSELSGGVAAFEEDAVVRKHCR